MLRTRTPLLLCLLVAPTAACGDAASRDRALTQAVAAQVRTDCQSAAGASGPSRTHLLRICDCTEAKIAATPIRFGESDTSISRKIEAASKACLGEIGGGTRDKAR